MMAFFFIGLAAMVLLVIAIRRATPRDRRLPDNSDAGGVDVALMPAWTGDEDHRRHHSHDQGAAAHTHSHHGHDCDGGGHGHCSHDAGGHDGGGDCGCGDGGGGGSD